MKQYYVIIEWTEWFGEGFHIADDVLTRTDVQRAAKFKDLKTLKKYAKNHNIGLYKTMLIEEEYKYKDSGG